MSWRAEVVLIGSGIFGSLALSALSPVLPDIESEYASMPNVAFWTKAVVTIDGIAMIAAPFAGRAARIVGGPRRLMILSYLTFLIAGLGGALVPQLMGIIATRFLVGIAGAFLITMAISLIGDRFEGRARELRIGFNHGTAAFLIGVMVPLSGWLGDHAGWRASFWVHLIALPFLLCLLAAPELGQFRTIDRTRQSVAGSILPVLPIALLALAGGSIALGFPIFLPFHLREMGIERATVAGLMFTVVATCSVFSSLSFGLIRRRVSAVGVFLLAFALWASGLATTGLATTLPVIALGIVIIGLGGGLVQPSLFSLIALMSDSEARARNNGLVKACFYGSPFLGTSVLHFLLGGYPAGMSMLALGGLALALMLVVGPVVGRTVESSD